jgi:RNA polymerase sigma-70 factor (ECF subfamily)
VKGFSERKFDMRDDEIISLYFDRSEQAIQESMDAYGNYCGKIAHNILKNREDAEEAVADTWLRAWNAIPPTRPNSLRIFLGRITRNLSLSIWRSKTAESRGGTEIDLALDELAECIGHGAGPEELVQTQELSRCVSEFLHGESDNNRVIFLRRYYYLESSKEIALRLGTSDSNVRMILSRTRKRLKDQLKKEGYIV